MKIINKDRKFQFLFCNFAAIPLLLSPVIHKLIGHRYRKPLNYIITINQPNCTALFIYIKDNVK